MAHRPPTADSSRPMTSTGSFSSPQDTYFDRDAQYTAYSQDYTIEEEDEDESEDEGVFAFQPPSTADALSQQPPSFLSPAPPTSPPPPFTPTPGPAYPAPTFDYSPRHHVPALPGPSKASLPIHTPVESPPSTDSLTNSRGYSTEDGFRLRRITPSSPGVSSREVHVTLENGFTPSTPGKRPLSDVTTSEYRHDFVDDERSIKMEFDFDAVEEEDSPYAEVRASVSNIDDPDMPAMTIRMWIVGLVLNALGSSLNVFFNFRSPAPTVVPLLMLVVAHPCGKLAAMTLPITVYRLPRWLGGAEFSFNPGPWNIKEHVLVFIMANVSIGPPYALNAVVVSELYYGLKLGFWFNIVLVLATQLTGFGLAGLCRRFLVWPASMVWPQNLIACTVLNTLHAEEDEGTDGISRYRYFIYVCTGAFFFFFIPGYLFQALSVFSWVCWIAPNNVVLNQVFGVAHGMGVSVLTFDWTQITWIGSPLMSPWWAEVHVFVGFVFFYWILTPILYYTDSWHLAHFPMYGTAPYDRFGNVYDVTRVLTTNDTFNLTAYNEYSPLYMPAAYAMTYLIAFALATCVIVHTLLYHGRALLNGVKRLGVEKDDIHAKLMRNYPEVPDWWYACVLVVFFSLSIVAAEVWKIGVPVWALLLSLVLPVVYVLPSGFIYAMTGQGITLNLLAQIVPGTLLEGNPLANMIFKAYSVQTLTEATSFVQDLKLGHYIKVPPRATFLVQLVSTFLAAFLQVGVKQWIFGNVPDICDADQKSHLTCPHNQVFFTASAIWGLIGPSRQFGEGSIYQPQLYAIAFGAVLPIPFWLWQRRRPAHSWTKYISTPIVLNGVSFIPPAVGINFSSWFLVGFIFQYVIRKRNFAWWSKFNYITSAALDTGTVLSLIIIFFTLQFPKGGINLNWWGNTVYAETADWAGTPLIQTSPDNPLPAFKPS